MHTTNVHAETVTSRVFPAIRLGDTRPVDSAAIEQHCLAAGDQQLRGLALQCVGATRKLLDQGAFASFLSQAVERAQAEGITPNAWLERTLQLIKSEIETTTQEHARFESRRKARADRLQPLKEAVSTRLTTSETEIKRLAELVNAADRRPFGGQLNQFQRLIDAGLKPEQIALVGTENPTDKIAEDAARAKARIEVLQAQLPALWAFSSDPRSDPRHLQGLDGFYALIAAAQNIVEEQP